MNRYRSRILGASLLAAVTLALAACTTTRPIPTTPSKIMVRAVQGDPEEQAARSPAAAAEQPRVVAVCYNGMVNDDAEILAEAVLACPAGKLTLRDDDVLWTSCPLLQPQRANFICVPEKPSEPPAPAQ